MENITSQPETGQSDYQQTTYESINADQVTVTNSGIKQISTQHIQATNCGIGVVQSGTASFTNSGMGVVNSQEVKLSDSGAIVAVSQITNISDSKAGLLISREIHGSKITSIVTIAGKIDAPVETIVDQRGLVLVGIAVGVAFGVVTSLFRYLTKNR